jgi:translocation and assembly module TamA
MRGPTGLVFKEHTRYDPALAQLDRDRIESLYARRGYFAAEVTDLDVRSCDGGVGVWFTVVEGQPSIIAEVEFDSAGEAISRDELRALTSDLRRGKVLVHQEYLDAKQVIELRLQERGYARAEVDGEVIVDRDQRTAAIYFALRPGPLVRYGQTLVEGADRIPDSAVLNRIEWEPGQRYSPALVEQTSGRLYALGVFDGVRVDLRRANDRGVSDVVIRVHEGHRAELRAGAGLAIDNANLEVRGRAGYTRQGIIDPLLSFDADARPAYTILRSSNVGRLGGQARLALRRPDLLVPLLEPLVEAWYDFIQLDAYEARGPGLGLSAGRPFLGRALQVGVGWKARWVDFTDIHPGITPEIAQRIGLVEPYRVGYFDQVLAYDRRDQLLDPHHGFFMQARAEEAGTYSGSRFDYAKLTGEMRGYVSPASRWVLATRVSLGSALSGEVPITQRYFSGGASSHRGFGLRELGPSVVDPEDGEAPLGGEAQLESSFEVRVDVRKLWGSWLGVVMFLDGGDVTDSVSDLDLANLHWAAGLGLRYETVVGPIRFDVGYRVNRTGPGNPQEGDHLAFHLSLGEAF